MGEKREREIWITQAEAILRRRNLKERATFRAPAFIRELRNITLCGSLLRNLIFPKNKWRIKTVHQAFSSPEKAWLREANFRTRGTTEMTSNLNCMGGGTGPAGPVLAEPLLSNQVINIHKLCFTRYFAGNRRTLRSL